jgi:hypothetical protein
LKCRESLVAAVHDMLPPGWTSSPGFPDDGHLTLAVAEGDGLCDVFIEGTVVATKMTLPVALHVLDAQLRARIAYAAPDRIFVHAGVVAVGDRAILLPGMSFAGKSTLVAALVSTGATYLSDEFAVLDAAGLVHP